MYTPGTRSISLRGTIFVIYPGCLILLFERRPYSKTRFHLLLQVTFSVMIAGSVFQRRYASQCLPPPPTIVAGHSHVVLEIRTFLDTGSHLHTLKSALHQYGHPLGKNVTPGLSIISSNGTMRSLQLLYGMQPKFDLIRVYIAFLFKPSKTASGPINGRFNLSNLMAVFLPMLNLSVGFTGIPSHHSAPSSMSS